MNRVVFGKPTLSRVACETCVEETIHRYGRCIHCGTSLRHAVVEHPAWKDEGGMAINPKSARRAA